MSLCAFGFGARAEESHLTHEFSSICLQSDAAPRRALLAADQEGWAVMTDPAALPGGMQVSPAAVLKRKTEAGTDYFLVLDFVSAGPGKTVRMCGVLSAPPQDARVNLRKAFSSEPMLKMNIGGAEAWGWTFIASADGHRTLLPSATPGAMAAYRSHKKFVVTAIDVADRSAIMLMTIPAAPPGGGRPTVEEVPLEPFRGRP